MKEVLEKLDNDNLVMIRRKNEGFYVDFDLKSRKITSTPDKFILADKQFIDTFNGFYLFTEEHLQTIQENLKRKTLQEAIKDVRSFYEQFRDFFSIFEENKSE